MRIPLGFITLGSALRYQHQLSFLYSQESFYTPALAQASEGGPLRWSLLWLFPSPGAVAFLYCLQLLAAALLCVGLWTRLSNVATYILMMSFYNRNVMNVGGWEMLLSPMLLLLCFAPSGRVWSLDRWRARPSEPPRTTWPMVIYLIRYQLCMTYFFSGLNKALGRYWVDGDAVLYPLMNPNTRHFELDWLWSLAPVRSAMHFFTWTVMIWELFFWLLICWKPTRYLAMGIGLCIHGGQALTIETSWFPVLLFTAYLSLLDPDDFARWSGLVLARLSRRLRRGGAPEAD